VTGRISLAGARGRIGRKSFIKAAGRENPVHAATCERLKSDPAWGLFEIGCGRDVMIDEPQWLAGVLEEVAQLRTGR
jgi:hypothetical protein